MYSEIGISSIRKIINAVKHAHGVNLDGYALSSLRRRVGMFIDSRYDIHGCEGLVDNIENLSFYNEFIESINVPQNEIFRDFEFWKKLKDEVFPCCFDKDKEYNVWNAGCSTGEELLTFLIAAKDFGILSKLKIYATDISEGVYGNVLLKDHSNDLNNGFSESFSRYNEDEDLKEYFVNEKDEVRKNPELFKNVTFSKFNLANDVNRKNFDLILSRNVLIYYNLPTKNKILKSFCNSLNKNGLLVLGRKESIERTEVSKSLIKVYESESIFKKK